MNTRNWSAAVDYSTSTSWTKGVKMLMVVYMYPSSRSFSTSRGITQTLPSSINAWLKETSFGKCKDYFPCPYTSNLLNCQVRIQGNVNYVNIRNYLSKKIKLWSGWAYFTSKLTSFFHVAEGSDFLRRGSTHPPSFPMFLSAPPLPSWKWTSIKADVLQLLKEITRLYIIYSTRQHKKTEKGLFISEIVLDAFTAHLSDTLTERRSLHSAFSSVVLDLKLANGCLAYITCQTVTISRTLIFFVFLADSYTFLQSEDLAFLDKDDDGTVCPFVVVGFYFQAG